MGIATNSVFMKMDYTIRARELSEQGNNYETFERLLMATNNEQIERLSNVGILFFNDFRYKATKQMQCQHLFVVTRPSSIKSIK